MTSGNSGEIPEEESDGAGEAGGGGARGFEFLSRRRMLGLSSVALASLAGCPGDEGDADTPTAGGDTPTESPTEAPTPSPTATDTATATATETESPTATRTPTMEPVFENFVAVDGTDFVVDGETYYPRGGNHPQLRKQSREAQETWLDDWTNAVGTNVLRATAFGSGTENDNAPLQPEPGEWDEQNFQMLDRLVALCGEAGVRLILPLTNYWPWQGGMEQYVKWSDTASEKHDFYTDDQTTEWYRAHIEKVLNRRNVYTGIQYKNDPTIMMWELANEPDGEGEDFYNWVADTAQYIKSIDSNHLVSTGMDDVWPWNQTEKNRRAHQQDGIDAYSVHFWHDSNHSELGIDGAVGRVQAHAAVANDLEMPIYAGEFGWTISRGDDSGNSMAERNRAFRAYLLAMREEGYEGSLFWDYRHSLEYPVTWNTAAIYPRDEETVSLMKRNFENYSSPPPDEPQVEVDPPALSVEVTEDDTGKLVVVDNTGGGTADEPAFSLSPEGDTYTDPDGSNSSVEPSNVSADFYLGYDADNLYVRAEVTDDTHEAKPGADMWQQDSIQIATGNADSAAYGPEYGISYTDQANVHRWFDGDAAAGVGEVDATGSRDGTTTTYDVTMPWKTLFAETREPGESVPFSVLVNDNDSGDNSRDNVLGWTLPGVNGDKFVSALGTVVLGTEGAIWNTNRGEGPFLVNLGERNTWTVSLSNVGTESNTFDISVQGADASTSVDVPGGGSATVSVERAFAAPGSDSITVELTHSDTGETKTVEHPVFVLDG
jgi:mannan endo-1,4-beta-mannosidase